MGFLRRLWVVLFQVHSFDYVFIHREASPIGPPVFEFLISRVFRKKIIYDFDDAIWIPDSENRLLKWVKSYGKIKWICRWSYKVAGGNAYLCRYAKQFNSRVFLIPTCVDIKNRHNRLKEQSDLPVTIGWTGSHSTLKYLEPLVPLLKHLAEDYNITIVVICNQPPSFSFKGLQFIQWKEDDEIGQLLKMHIGIMPLPADPWSEGKCGFKLIQYLSLGIPAVASPVGVNTNIIDQGVNGFLCSNEAEWKNALLHLIQEKELRQQMGAEGRKKIVHHFSIQAYEKSFACLFK
jgi:glycosyltransferase involved in cell wall biosynthesis